MVVKWSVRKPEPVVWPVADLADTVSDPESLARPRVLSRTLWRILRWLRGVAYGLRGRVALLCLLTALPLLLLLALSATVGYVIILNNADERVVQLARAGADYQKTMVADVSNVLRLLGEVPAVRGMQPDICTGVVRRVAEADQRIDFIAVVRSDGLMTCGSQGDAWPINVADRAYFKRALVATDDASTVTEVLVSRLSGLLRLIVAVPLPAGPDGKERPGIIAASLSLDWLSHLAAQAPDQTSRVANVADAEDGRILAHKQSDSALKTQVVSSALLRAFGTMPEGGAIHAPDGRGEEMIFGVAPIQVGSQKLMLFISEKRAAVLAAARRRIRVGAAMAIAVTLSAMLVAWSISQKFLLRPIEELAGVASRLGAGELSARAPRVREVTELRALGLAFNRMASRLQSRNRQLAATQADLRRSEEHHRLLADNSGDMITRFGPDFRRTYVSPACIELLGYAPEELVGQEPGGIVYADDWLVLDATLNAPLKSGQETARAAYRALRKDGTLVWLESTGRRLPRGDGYVVVTRDISERKAFELRLEQANRQLEELALRDALTGLANRRQFDRLLESECRRTRRLDLPLGMLIVDVDHFKGYNDAYGHPAGDVCLRAVASAIEGVLRRPGDAAGRLGGEEFGVLLPNTDTAGATFMAQRICDAVRQLGLTHAACDAGVVTVSVGAAVVRLRDGGDAASLVELADKALYAAKREGRDTVRATS